MANLASTNLPNWLILLTKIGNVTCTYLLIIKPCHRVRGERCENCHQKLIKNQIRSCQKCQYSLYCGTKCVKLDEEAHIHSGGMTFVKLYDFEKIYNKIHLQVPRDTIWQKFPIFWRMWIDKKAWKSVKRHCPIFT